MKSVLLRLIGFPLVGFFAFLVFLLLTFPEQQAQILVQRNVEKMLDHKYRVEMVEFEFGIFSGIEMRGVSLSPRFQFEKTELGGGDELPSIPAPGEDGGDDEDAPQYFCPDEVDPLPVLFDEILIDPSLLALMTGSLESDFSIEAAGGSITGSLGSEGDGQTFKAEINDLVLQRFTLLRNTIEMHMMGWMGGDVDLEIDEAGRLTGGSVGIDLAEVVLCPKKFKIADPRVPFVELPLTRMGAIAGTLEITSDRKMEFKDFTGTGEDVDLEISGHIQMATEQRPKTSYDLRVKLTPDQSWVQENAMGFLDTMCRKSPDGSYTILITGVSGQVKKDCVKNRGGAGGARSNARSSASRRTPPPAPAPAPMDEDPPIDEPMAGDDVNMAPAPIRPNPALDRNQSLPYNAGELRKSGVQPVPVERRKELLNKAYGPR